MSTSTDTTDIGALEARLRERLRGVRLVSEIGITPRERNELRTLMVLYTRGKSYPAPWVSSHWPSIYVTYLVSVAIEHGRGGELWPHTIRAIQQDTSTAGESFVSALQRLGLPTFDDLVEEERAFKYIGRVVAHAGLPAPSAVAFLAFLAHVMRRDGVRSADDFLAMWRTERTALAALPAPARRFLLYGGRPAGDLLGRCIEAIADVSRLGRAPTAAESGLPAHVAEALAAVPQAELGKPLRAPTGIARPTVELDPFDNLAVVAVLPAVSAQKLGSRWRIWDGEQDREVAASSISTSRIRLRPAPAWSIEFMDVAGLSRTWTFEGLERTGALVIDPQSGVLSRTPTVIEDDQAWILYPSTWSLRADGGGLAELVEMPSLPGSWSSYSVVHADLTDVTELRLSSLIDPTSGARIRVFPGAQRPSLVGEAVAGVRTEQGDPVFSCAPVVQVPRLEGVPDDRWRFQLRRNDGAPTTFIDPDGVHAGTVDLAGRVGVESGLFRLSVRGPLGTDIVTTFAVVRELTVDRPTMTIFPDDERPTVIVTAGSGIALEDGGAGEPVRLGVPVGVRSLAFRAGSATRQLDLRIDLPSLVWTLVHETKPAAAAGVERLRVGAEEFDDELADALVVRVGRPDVALGLSVRDGREFLADELSAHSAGPDGRWAFDLAPLAPTIRQHADLAPSVWLRVGSRELCVADVIPQLVLTKLQAQSRVVDDFSHVHVSFEQERRPRHRVVRLWSLDRPWDPPISAPVADDATSAQLSGWDVIPAGRYIVQVTVDDGWGVARRPASGARHTAPIWVGDKDQVTERLSRLDPAAPLQALELIANGRSVACELDDPEAHDVATAAAWCLLQDIEDLDPDDGPNHRFRRWAQYVLAQPATAVRALVDVVAEDAFADDVVLRAQLALVVQLDDVCVSDDDVLRRAWRSLPILAATVDRGDDADARSRRERYLFAGPQAPISPGAGQVDQRMAGRAVTELREMRRTLALVPDAALDDASVLLACFEWLAVEIDDEREPQAPTPSAWLDRFGHLVEQLPADLPDAIRAHIDGRARAQGTIFGGLTSRRRCSRRACISSCRTATAGVPRWPSATRSASLRGWSHMMSCSRPHCCARPYRRRLHAEPARRQRPHPRGVPALSPVDISAAPRRPAPRARRPARRAVRALQG